MNLRAGVRAEMCIRLTEDDSGFIFTRQYAKIRLSLAFLTIKKQEECRLKHTPAIDGDADGTAIAGCNVNER
ncbi:MAG: hypothetical protein JOY85_15680 [Acidobacteriaceae bacterium]|nr:hypothetical protein [Acidobacteriaceae bacterium]